MRLQSSAATAAMFTTQGNSRSKLAPALQIIEIRTNSYRAERVYNSGEYMYYWYSSPWMSSLYQAVDGKIYVSIANPEIILKVLLKCVIIMIKANLGGIIKMNKNRIAITLMTAIHLLNQQAHRNLQNRKKNPLKTQKRTILPEIQKIHMAKQLISMNLLIQQILIRLFGRSQTLTAVIQFIF